VHKLDLTSGVKDPIMCAFSASESIVTVTVNRAVGVCPAVGFTHVTMPFSVLLQCR
jgi:hypothetical protein